VDSYTLPFGLQMAAAPFQRQAGARHRRRRRHPAYADSYGCSTPWRPYPINKHIDLRLNVYNLADKEYVQAINKSGYRYLAHRARAA
jgi:catecholate siderophore receptor